MKPPKPTCILCGFQRQNMYANLIIVLTKLTLNIIIFRQYDLNSVVYN